MDKLSTTRRTLAQARRMPQWQRLITSIHKAQEAKGFAGRQFGEDEMEFFNARLIGIPVEMVPYHAKPADFAAYWVERQQLDHSEYVCTVRYVLKAVYGDDLAQVYTIAHESRNEPESGWEATTALDFVKRANHQAGRWTK